MAGKFFRPTELFQQKKEKGDTAVPFTVQRVQEPEDCGART